MINLYNSYTEKAIEIMRKGGICTPDELKIIDAAYSYISYGECDGRGSHDYNTYYLGFGYCVIIVDVQVQEEGFGSDEEAYMENAEEYEWEYPLGQMYFLNLAKKKFRTYDELVKNYFTCKLEDRRLDPRNDEDFNAIFQLGGMVESEDYYCFSQYVNYYLFYEEYPYFEGVIVLNNHEECRILLKHERVDNRPEYTIYDTSPRFCGDFSYWCNGECKKDYSDSYTELTTPIFLSPIVDESRIIRVTG